MQPHRLDFVSLIAGVLLVGTGGAHLLGAPSVLSWLTVLRVWPILLVAGGLVILVGLLRRTDDT